MENAASSGRQRVWITTAEACDVLGISRETLRQLRLRGCCNQASISAAGAAPKARDPCSGMERTWKPLSRDGVAGTLGVETEENELLS